MDGTTGAGRPNGDAERARRYRERGWWPGVPLVERFRRFVHDRPDALAVADDRGRRLSREQLWREAGRLGAELAERGIGAGDVVLVFMPNRVESLVATLAALRQGAVPANLPIRTDEDTLRYAADLCGARALVTVERHGRTEPGEMALAAAGKCPPLACGGDHRRRRDPALAGPGAGIGASRPAGRPRARGTNGGLLVPGRGTGPPHVHLQHHRAPEGGHAHRRHPRGPQRHLRGALRARARCADLHAVAARAQCRGDPRRPPRAPHRRAPRPPGPVGPHARPRSRRHPRLPLHRRRDPLPQGPRGRTVAGRRIRRPGAEARPPRLVPLRRRPGPPFAHGGGRGGVPEHPGHRALGHDRGRAHHLHRRKPAREGADDGGARAPRARAPHPGRARRADPSGRGGRACNAGAGGVRRLLRPGVPLRIAADPGRFLPHRGPRPPRRRRVPPDHRPGEGPHHPGRE